MSIESRGVFRALSEEHSALRRDAINFAYYKVIHWLDNRATSTCPPLLHGKFWSHCYRLVSDYKVYPTTIFMYALVKFDSIHGVLANSYGVDIMTRISQAIKDVFLKAREVLGKLLTAGEAKIGQLYSDLPNEHATALREIFRLQYTRWHTVFGNNKLDVITDFSYATPQRIPTLLQYYANLLKDIDSYQIAVKRWSLIPIATHQIVHVNYSAASTMFHLLQRMKLKGPMPNFEVQESVERDTETTPNGYRLAYGFRTDGHMISVHFQKYLQGRRM
ncbi:hypothetical protein EDC94DRAFT_586313 [Helicostylum pulchrum]|nr:hypothetical protein EDC94DRAFT_586313 [Helicostylum pulchrum]